VGETLQKVGREIGVTTGRKRRCGWLDLVVVKYSNDINHYTRYYAELRHFDLTLNSLNITKLDILDDFSELKVATNYSYKGETLPSFPGKFDTATKTMC
jgi:adenylosuccinate synthase